MDRQTQRHYAQVPSRPPVSDTVAASVEDRPAQDGPPRLLVRNDGSGHVGRAAAPVASNADTAPGPVGHVGSDGNIPAAAASAAVSPGYTGIFASSVCAMFQSHAFTRTDACALACCGVWLWERNRFMFDGTEPKPWNERPYVVAMVLSVVLVGFVYSQFNPSSSRLALSFLVLLLAVVLLVLLRFQQERNRFRLVLAEQAHRLHSRNDGTGNAGTGNASASREHRHPRTLSADTPARNDRSLQLFFYRNQKEISRVHMCCGCYGADILPAARDLALQQQQLQLQLLRQRAGHEQQQHTVESPEHRQVYYQTDFCRRLWNLLSACCCNSCCSSWCLFCGICAIAQEHRFLRTALLPSSAPSSSSSAAHTSADAPSGRTSHVEHKAWQHDYITFQHWADYAPALRRIRETNDLSWTSHCTALSDLSQRLLSAISAILLVVLTLAVLPFIKLSFWQFPILLAALLQPAIILYFVYWNNDRLDISLDAVVKYFASGFIIATGMALVYETLVSVVTGAIVNLTAIIGVIFFTVEAMDESDEDAADADVQELFLFIIVELILSAFLNAFVIAALIEELAKYLSFWMVEHPDMLDVAESTGTSSVTASSPNFVDDDRSNGNGRRGDRQDGIRSFNSTRSMVSKGSMITIAMVSTALGFACAENLLYVFVYTPPDAAFELVLLAVRSLFPIHPLAAAMQSIGVCRRDLEKDYSTQVGRILYPAWMLHGLYDFVLMAYGSVVAFFQTMNDDTSSSAAQPADEWNDDYNGGGYKPYYPSDDDGSGNGNNAMTGREPDYMQDLIDGIPSMVIAAIIASVALAWYFQQARMQRLRLMMLDGISQQSDSGLQLEQSSVSLA